MRNLEEFKEKEIETSKEASSILLHLFLKKNPKFLLILALILLIIFLFSEVYKKLKGEGQTRIDTTTAGISGEVPVKGKVVFSYKGKNREVKKILVPRGTPVNATDSGTVIYVGYHQKLGKTVILKHKYGYYTIYGHLGKINVVEGVYIRRGYPVGYSGNAPIYYEKRKWLYHLNR